MDLKLLAQNIRNTLSFFALFERGLTLEECTLFLYEKENGIPVEGKNVSHIESVLLTDRGYRYSEGAYYLSGASYPVHRSRQEDLQKKLMKKCIRYLPLLRFVPFVRLVAIGNTHAFGAADEESDIDVFIVAEEGHVWCVRFLTGMLLQILGVRRHGKKVAARFCLSFYIDQQERNFEKIMLPEGDVYMHFWIATLLPIIGEKEYDAFIEANAPTLRTHFPNWTGDARKAYLASKEVGGRVQRCFEYLFSTRIGAYVERSIRALQKNKMHYIPVARTGESSVVVTDHMLKFHNKDRRKKYREEWNQLRTSL